jgi:hypothetical protein
MLDLLRQKAAALGLDPRVYLQTMETLDLPRRYRVILVPSSSFQLLTEPVAAAEALRGFYWHLEPGGVLVMSLNILQEAGFADVHLTSGFTFTPAAVEDTLFCVFGTRPRLS